jgi:hypothetical protein
MKDLESESCIPRFCSVVQAVPRLYFGGFPLHPELRQLQDRGIKFIVDLTTPMEKKRLDNYNAKDYDMTYISFPIEDNFIPRDMNAFHEFMTWLAFTMDSLKPEESVYIHCKGGHGRSGMIVACLLCFHYHINSSESIRITTEAHRNRPQLTPKWKTRLCPSNGIQRLFVHRIYQMSTTTTENLMIKADPMCRNLESTFNSARKRILETGLLQHPVTTP